jgi:hypothetical protein
MTPAEAKTAVGDDRVDSKALLAWWRKSVRPFLQQHAV